MLAGHRCRKEGLTGMNAQPAEQDIQPALSVFEPGEGAHAAVSHRLTEGERAS
jgi:hypothetical protein